MWRLSVAVAACSALLIAESPRVALLEIRVENVVVYRFDVAEQAQRAAQPREVTAAPARSFLESSFIGDIVSINGTPAKGVWVNHGMNTAFSPNPAPTFPIANVESGSHYGCAWNVFTADGAFVGEFVDRGILRGAPNTSHALLGGTGAYLGAVGEHLVLGVIRPERAASVAEDPALRQSIGGGIYRIGFYVTPRYWPDIETTADGPSVFHADGSRVSPARPAAAGELLIVRAKGLGPTRPNLAPIGFRAFGADPFEEVNSPISVSVGGSPAEVLNKIGWPGTKDVYRLDIRVPDGVRSGMAPIQITAAWIPGEEVLIPVR
jgi:hypothetical protein